MSAPVRQRRINAFSPILGEEPKVLVLGTMPSVESLRRGMYYGHPRNHFWPIIYRVFGEGEPPEEYREREKFLESRGIAVWDVFAACEREGSLDQNIMGEEYRDIGKFLTRHPSIRLVALNGTRAERGFRRGLRVYGWIGGGAGAGTAELKKTNGGCDKVEILLRLPDGSDLPIVREVRVVPLPSTSPIPSQKYRKMEDKLEAWRVVTEI